MSGKTAANIRKGREPPPNAIYPNLSPSPTGSGMRKKGAKTGCLRRESKRISSMNFVEGTVCRE